MGELVQTDNFDLAALCSYLYGDQVVRKIEIVDERGRAMFSLAISQNEFDELQRRLFRDEINVMLRSYQSVDKRLRWLIRETKRAGGMWENEQIAEKKQLERSPEWWAAGQAAAQQRQKDREMREWRVSGRGKGIAR